jgi:hypothetical protein
LNRTIRPIGLFVLLSLTLQANSPDSNTTTLNRSDHNVTELSGWADTALGAIDTVYDYGTAAVIVIGSAIDHAIYDMFTDDNTTDHQSADGNASEIVILWDDENHDMTAETEEKAELLADLKSEDSDIKAYVKQERGKVALPKQLDDESRWREGERTYLMSKWFDKETMNDSFLDMGNNSYLRIRGGYAWDYRGENEWIHSVAARVKIPRSKDRFDLIVGDETKETSDLSKEGTQQERDNSIALGLNRNVGPSNLVKSKFRVGFSGVDNPYGKADFRYEALFEKWLIEPSQTFRYSIDSEFEEWTNLKFRRRISGTQVFEMLFQRSSISHVKGWDYLMQPSVSFATKAWGNWTPYIGAYGRTREQPENDEGYIPKRGVYQYAVGLNWTKQAERKYIVYRIQPIVSYHHQYEYRPNYFLKGLLEFYFGVRD